MNHQANNSQIEEQKLGRLKGLGVTDIYLAPLLLPKSYLDLRVSEITYHLREVVVDQRIVFVGVLKSFFHKRDCIPNRVTLIITDARATELTSTFFIPQNDTVDFSKELGKKTNQFVCLTGTVGLYQEKLQLHSPEFIDINLVGKVIPNYPGKAKYISSNTVREQMKYLVPNNIVLAAAWIKERLDLGSKEESDLLSVSPFLAKNPTIEYLISQAHNPTSPKSGVHCCKILRLIATYDVLKRAREEASRPLDDQSIIDINPRNIDQLLSETAPALIPTDEQRVVINEICDDLRSKKPMLRLLSADVGFGKTYVAATAGAGVIRSGGTTLWLCPNQPLAVQTQQKIMEWWPDINPGLVMGDAKGITDSRFLIGTTALLHRIKADMNVNLLIIDESQKFGKDQMDYFITPGTNVLYSTATCIPRTAALLEYGGLSVSRITKAHVQKTIKTRMVFLENREKLFDSLRRNIIAGHQALIIYPLAESNEDAEVDRKSAEGAYKLWEINFPGRVRYMHGKLSNQEKINAIAAMRNNEADILIATTAVETGIDLPRLRHVMVVQAERLGVNQLHQLRGRASRTGGIGRFDLYFPKRISDTSRARMEILINFSDGFDVANENMKIQGFGDLGTNGTAQSGKSLSFLPGHNIDQQSVEWVCEHWFKNDS